MLKRRAAQTEPYIAVSDTACARRLVARQPSDLWETQAQGFKWKRHATREGREGSECAQRREKTSEHEIVAEVSGPVEMVPEMNAHGQACAGRKTKMRARLLRAHVNAKVARRKDA